MDKEKPGSGSGSGSGTGTGTGTTPDLLSSSRTISSATSRIFFSKYTKEAGKEQYLILYFIAAHPSTSDEDMLNLALWLKKNGFRADQVQAFYPSPMASATTMYHTDKNPLHQVTYKSEKVQTAKSPEQRKLHKAFLHWHDPKN